MSEYENDKINEQQNTSSQHSDTEKENTRTQYSYAEQGKSGPPKKRNLGARRTLAVVVVAICIALIFGVSTRLGYYLGSGDSLGENTPATTSPSGENAVTPPAVTVPEGMEFLGWFRESMDENGDTVFTRVFTPSENGTVTLPSDYELSPMVLHARFQKEGG